MRRLLLEEFDLTGSENPIGGFKIAGLDSPTFSIKDSDGNIERLEDEIIYFTQSIPGEDYEILLRVEDGLETSSLFRYIVPSENLITGTNNAATGTYGFVEGFGNTASSFSAHVEGLNNLASEWQHVEGHNNVSYTRYTHVLGENNLSTNRASFVAGYGNVVNGGESFAIGRENLISGVVTGGFVGGYNCTLNDDYGFAFGSGSIVSGNEGFALGYETDANFYAFSHGKDTRARFSAHAEGLNTYAPTRYTHAEGLNTQGGGTSVAEYYESIGVPYDPDGDGTPGPNASGAKWYDPSINLLHNWNGTIWISQNDEPISIGIYDFNIGSFSFITFGPGDDFSPYADFAAAARYNYGSYYTHAEGESTEAIGEATHTEGELTESGGHYSHAEGGFSRTGLRYKYGSMPYADFPNGAPGLYAHAEGYSTWAEGWASHTEGWETWAIGTASSAEGLGTIAYESFVLTGTPPNAIPQAVMGRYNTYSNSILAIGNGTSNSGRSNLAEFRRLSITFYETLYSEDITATGTVEANQFTGDGSGLTNISGTFRRGNGSPEGVVSAPTNTFYINLLGGVNQTLWVKESGSGNTGWVAK